jgi:hypothetical protein
MIKKLYLLSNISMDCGTFSINYLINGFSSESMQKLVEVFIDSKTYPGGAILPKI